MSHVIAVHPIRTDRDLQDALIRIEVVLGAEPGTPENDELDVLADLVEAYERRHHSIRSANGIDVLQHLIEANELTHGDLPEIGSQGEVSEILTGKRDLTVRQIRALAARFKVAPGVFV